MSARPVVFVPCPGRPACPDRLFQVDGHQHFRRAVVQVRRVLPGCWEVRCPCCAPGSVVAQVSSWGRAMQRAGQHLADGHSPFGRTLIVADPQPPKESAGQLVEPAWWWVDHFDSDREYHLYCSGCRAQIPGFLVRFASQAGPVNDRPCEGCGVGG